MRELRFHRDVYSGRAVDEALGHFEQFATFEREVDGSYWVVRIEGASRDRTRRIAGELANYALGLTVERGGADEEGQP